MLMPYLHSLGHLVVITHMTHINDSFAQLFGRFGFGEKELHQAKALLDQAVTAMAEVARQLPDDRISDHEVHIAVGQVEMWHQALGVTLSQFYDATQTSNLIGSKIHGPTHPLTVIAQGVHLLNLIRTSPSLINQLGGTGAVTDHINRGWVMLNRVYTSMRYQTVAPLTLESYAAVMDWLIRLNNAVEAANPSKEDVTRLVFSGFLPDGHGLPLGGSGVNIVLHERGQSSLPDPNATGSTSGWSIGRHGNNENLGKGWL